VSFYVTEITKFLLFASNNAIRGVSFYPNHFDITPPEAITPITSGDSKFVAVDYDATEDYIYYSDINKGFIYRIHTNGTGTHRAEQYLIWSLTLKNLENCIKQHPLSCHFKFHW
jgi:hypothetical protein